METPGSSAGRLPGPQHRLGTGRMLWGFLALFALLLFAFRAVLFPFLMAIFLAYLVEPVVGWASRGKRFGLRWGRGPVLILVYVFVLVGAVLMVSCGVNRLSTSVKSAVSDLKKELDKTAPAAKLTIEVDTQVPIRIPAGTGLVTVEAPNRTFKTSYATQLGDGAKEVRVLLDSTDRPDRLPPPPGVDLTFQDLAALKLPEGVTVQVETDDAARGLEILTEKKVIAPVSAKVEDITGEHIAPGILREFIAEQSRTSGPDLGSRVLNGARGVLFAVVGSTYQLVLVLMLTAFIVIDRRRISAFFASLPPPENKAKYERLMEYVDRGLAGVIRGQLVICVVNGLLTWMGLQFFGVPYASLLALLAGVFSLIPVFGTIASSIPIVLVALTWGGLHAAVMSLIWISLIHLLEANVFNPLIMGTSAEMHPVVIIFALLAGEHAFGVWGALLAVPTASIIQSCFKYYRHEVLGIPPEEPHGHGKWITSLLGRAKAKSEAKAQVGEPAVPASESGGSA